MRSTLATGIELFGIDGKLQNQDHAEDGQVPEYVIQRQLQRSAKPAALLYDPSPSHLDLAFYRSLIRYVN